MELTAKQEEGIKLGLDCFNRHDKFFIISGYAGTGKSTLIRFLIDSLHVQESDVCYCAYTGKATQVLQKKGCHNVSTLHKLLYKSIPLQNGKFLKVPVESIPYKIIVVDEVSMVPKTLIEQLFKYPVFIICLGDPYQLPPIKKEEDNGLLNSPHIFLDEIVRQAKDNDIIRFSMDIREGNPIQMQKSENLIVMPKEALNTSHLDWANQIICATNNMKNGINGQMRMRNGFGTSPQNGDKVICTRNYWDYCSDDGDALVNGTIGFLNNVKESFITLPSFCNYRRVKTIDCDFISDSGMIFRNLTLESNTFLAGQSEIDWKTSYKISKSKKGIELPLQFEYGSAITCHKSQGSEWDKVLFIEENFPFDKEEHRRHGYTAVTRAVDQLIFCLKR